MAARPRRSRSSESVDNYLKAILSLSGPEMHRVSSKALANRLEVATASVTNMLQKLAAASASLVEYERHRGVLLSAAGKQRALEIVRHHRLIETFLYKVLDYPLEEVHDEAERLEHFISERFEERIAAKLGHPKIDPHGHSIPSLSGEMLEKDSMLLTDVAAKGDFVIESVSDRDARVLRFLETHGVAPGVRLRVKSQSTKAGYTVSVGRSAKVFEISRVRAGEVRVLREAVAGD
jgi:DtxR family Mn-dependent transcriptional regulator